MHLDIKLNKNSKKKKKMLSTPLGLFSRRAVFLEVLELSNPYKIATSLSNAITFLQKM